jgi:P27 family predicted phage terminase small subunit
MKGRKPQPSALRVLRGNPGRRPLPPDEPTPEPTVNAAPPEWLDEEAKAEWHRLAPMLERLGVLTESDTGALTAYCEAWATWKGATQKIRQFGMVIKGRNEIPMQSPYVRIAHNALIQMRGLLVEFGLTPSSRARVHAVKKPDAPVSKWAGIK